MTDLAEILCLSEGREPPRCPHCDGFMDQDLAGDWHCPHCAETQQEDEE